MAADLRHRLLEGKSELPRAGRVVRTGGLFPPYVVLGGDGSEVEPVTEYLKDLALSDVSVLTPRSYGYDLLRWLRLLAVLEVAWDRATPSELDVLVGWMKSAPNPQRRRSAGGTRPGVVNPLTGKPSLKAGYAPRTINHCLTVIHGFYAFHAIGGRGPVVNPVPESRQQRAALSHRSPLETKPTVRRGRLRQKVPQQAPRAVPDRLWDELFAAMRCNRDRALLEIYVSSGARASELLGALAEDVGWAEQLIYVISKGTRLRQGVPISPQGLRYLAAYLREGDPLAPGDPLWRTRRGEPRALTYWAMRRVLQRANEQLGTNWTLHDLRHTASTRMANGGTLTLAEVQTILRHADINTTGVYLTVRIEDMFDRLQEHYTRPRPVRTYAAGYSADDMKAVFGE
ncbi:MULTISPECIES: tyrosine-type recombinase/integrase [Streptomyces]|uniref:Tyrosine-type recombinase/integrase n=2 Tax=Streptomyces TaxID=1883 RepID=A0ABV9J5U6_9ACTN